MSRNLDRLARGEPVGNGVRRRYCALWHDGRRGRPHRQPPPADSARYLRSDNGPEFVATAILRWTQSAGIETAFIDPGKPWQNGTDESFNGRFRNECLTVEWFRNRVEAKVGIERWRRHYNEERPHMSLGDQTPAEFKAQTKIKSGWLGEGSANAILQ
jgi:transposase InsO family protein